MTRHLSLRNRVLLVGLIAVGVSVGLSQYQYRAERTRRLAVAGRNAMVTASTASAAVGFVLQDLYGFIHGAEEAPAVRDAARAPEACQAFLQTALERGSARVMVSNIFVVNAEGRVLCQARDGSINARDGEGHLYPWMLAQFQRDYLLTASTPFYGPISKSWVVIFSAARSAPDGGVLATAVNLEQFNQILEPIGGVNTLVTVADAEGNTMLRSADFARRVSQKVPFRSSVPGLSQRMWGDPVARDTAGRIMAAQQEPVISTDSSGIERVWAASLVPGVPWVVYSGMSTETTDVPVWIDATVLMATGTVAAILALLATVSRDISRLVRGVARSATDGPLAIPVDGSKEVVDLGLALRQALERRVEMEAELAAANRDLERRVQERSAELQAKAYDLESANAQLVTAARIKDDFLAVMSHELRTPLSSVLGLTESLREGVYGAVTPQQDQALRQAEDAGVHLLGLVNDVLDFSKVQSGGFSLEWDDVEVCEVLEASIALVQPLADARQLRIVVPPTHESVLLRGDARRLRQVFVNLLGNAVKFTPEGGRIEISCALGGTPPSVTLRVRDTGIGISPDDLARIFEPFTQAHQGLDRRFSGTGLGLALSQAIVRAHGGALTAESQLGEGATFSVRLPIGQHGQTPQAVPSA